MNKPFYQKAWFWIVIAIVVLGIGGAGMASSNTDDSTNRGTSSTATGSNTNLSTPTNEEKEKSNNEYTLGDTFDINGFTVTFGTNYKFATVDNQFSDSYGKTVVGIPLTETNNTEDADSVNEFSLSIFLPSGTETSWSIGSLFDDSKVKAGDILPGASQTSYLYFLFEEPGEYQIHISNYTLFQDDIIVKATIEQTL